MSVRHKYKSETCIVQITYIVCFQAGMLRIPGLFPNKQALPTIILAHVANFTIGRNGIDSNFTLIGTDCIYLLDINIGEVVGNPN